MITNTNADADAIELYRERKSRLQRLLKMDAPEAIIRSECSLVLRSLTGGSRTSVIWYLVKDLIENFFRGLQANFEFKSM